MKAEVFIRKLESCPGSHVFSTQDRSDVFELAREFSGRYVLAKWEEYLRLVNRSFSDFSGCWIRIRKKEFLERLQGEELIPFSPEEEKAALTLAGDYPEKDICTAWRYWKREKSSGFMEFCHSAKEVIFEKKEVEENTKPPIKDDPFAQVFAAVRSPQKTSTRKEDDKEKPTGKPWVFSKEENSWTVDGFPVF